MCRHPSRGDEDAQNVVSFTQSKDRSDRAARSDRAGEAAREGGGFPEPQVRKTLI